MALPQMPHNGLSQSPGIQTIQGVLEWGCSELSFLSADEARNEMEWILCEVLGINQSVLFLEYANRIDFKFFEKIKEIIGRRCKREPLAYILGRAPFYEECLSVSPDCLIPRPETEILVEHFLQASGFTSTDTFCFLDLGTGSGAIALSLLRKFPNAKATLSDISERALAVAQKNLRAYGLTSRAEFICSNYFEALRERQWQAIISNPPYLSAKDFEALQSEISFEPHLSIWGGLDGLDFYRRLSVELSDHLKPDGFFALEMGQGQAEAVKKLFEDQNFSGLQIVTDYAGIQRVLSGKK